MDMLLGVASIRVTSSVGSHLILFMNHCHDEWKWKIAGGGTETPFTYNGETFLYMWNLATGQHAYYNYNRDIFVKDFRTNELLDESQI
jgi:hypothetical protein